MARDETDATPLTSRNQLVAWIEAGEKPPHAFRVGTEHEKIPFYVADHTPVPYDGRMAAGQAGIQALLKGMQQTLGWEPILDGPNLIGLHDPREGGAISLEPGGQFELSGAPLATIHATDGELDAHFKALRAVAEPSGIGFLTLGMSPKWSTAATPVMPKQRYAIMAGYMPKVGSRGLDMMFRTATVQANLDYADETDMVKKLRVGLALQPIATALFANSPFTDGKLNGFLSARSEIWRDTDRARTGMLPFAFEPGMGYERYVDFALDVPMYFVKRGETYHDVTGGSFRDLLAGRLAAMPGERATLSDWTNHLSTIFPEVRLKRFLEMRGADTGPRPFLTALPALFVGLFYDRSALDAASDLIGDWTADMRETLRAQVPHLGLEAPIGGRTVRAVAREVLSLARKGLVARAERDAAGRDEAYFLDPLDHVVETGSHAEALIEKFRSVWDGSVEPSFAECVY